MFLHKHAVYKLFLALQCSFTVAFSCKLVLSDTRTFPKFSMPNFPNSAYYARIMPNYAQLCRPMPAHSAWPYWQVTVHCAERGSFLSEIWEGHTRVLGAVLQRIAQVRAFPTTTHACAGTL